MGFDGLYMRRVVDEISKKNLGRLKNIYQVNSVTYFFDFQGGGVKISLKPDLCYMALSDKSYERAVFPSSFTMLLRKKLKNSIFEGISQDGFLRVAKMTFRGFDDMGDERIYSLYVEIMGKFSNMILVDDSGLVVDAHRRIVTSKGREILPGRPFKAYVSSKVDPRGFEVDEGVMEDPVREIVRRVEGVSTLVSREVVHRAEAMGGGIEGIERAWKEFLREYDEERTYLVFLDGKVFDFSVIRLTHLEGAEFHEKAPSEAVLIFSKIKEEKDVFLNKKSELEGILNRELKRLFRILQNVEEDIKESEGYERYRKFGELLLINQRAVSKDGKVVVEDWESGASVEIPLIDGKSPVESAKLYFGKYKKMKRKHERSVERRREIEEEIEYLESVKESLYNAESLEDLLEVEEELVRAGLKKEGKRKKIASKKRSSGPRRVYFGDYLILIGKNNKQNEEILRNASPNDLWFHAHGIPGAHVVLKSAGREVEKEALEYAASLAAGYSRGRDSGRVAVDYTLVKHVKKPKGSKPGFVLYTNYKTIKVTPKRLD